MFPRCFHIGGKEAAEHYNSRCRNPWSQPRYLETCGNPDLGYIRYRHPNAGIANPACNHAENNSCVNDDRYPKTSGVIGRPCAG